MGKIILGVLAIFLLIGGFSAQIIAGVHNLRTDETSDASVVVTGAGVTTANVTLDGDLFQADTDEVIGIESTIAETPVPTAYTEATNVLYITNLAESQTRTLTVSYYAETDDPVWLVIGPFANFLIIGGLLGIIIWAMFGSGGKRH